MIVNEGQGDKILANEHHEKVISKELFDAVQQAIQNRNRK